MKIKNALLWQDYSLAQAWLGTSLTLLGAFGLRYILHSIIEPYAVFHFFIVGCLLTQYFFGYKFSLPSMLIAMVLAEYYFIAPYETFNGLERKDIVITLNFLVVTGVAIGFMEKLRRIAYSQELLLKVMESRHRISLYRENDRLYYSKKSNEVWAILEEFLSDHQSILFWKYGSEFGVGAALYRMPSRPTANESFESWLSCIHSDDLSLLRGNLDGSLQDKQFALRMFDGTGAELGLQVMIEQFKFMGKRLSVVRLTDDFKFPGTP